MNIKEYTNEKRTLGYILNDKAEKLRDKVFIYYEDKAVTYEELNNTTNIIANTFIHKFDVKKGDKISVMLPNCPDSVFMQFGIPKTGAIQVPINTELTSVLFEYTINNCDADILIIDDKFFPKFSSISSQLRHLKKVFVKANKFEKEKYRLCKNIDIFSYEELFDSSDRIPDIDVNWYDPVAIFYTSGTTGVSKGIVLPHNHHYDFGHTIAEWARLGPKDIFYICLPFYHGLAQYMSVMPALLAEGSIAIAERFSASGFWNDIRRYNATAVFVIYTVVPILLKQPEREDDSNNPLRVCCTIGFAPSTVDTFQKRFGVNMLDMFGSTEQGGIAFTPYDKKKYGASGPINTRDYEVKIVNEYDEELPIGSIGEYVSRAKKPFIRMIEYYGMSEETVKATRNLWLHSGDAARIDEEGWIYFEGRLKDSIRRGGENISAFELESLAGSYDKVHECAAIPIGSELGEDEIKLYVVPTKGEPFDLQAFEMFCEEKMPRYMIPRYIEIVENIQKTGTGKVEKVKLQKQGLTINTWDIKINGYVRVEK
jgi:crotonobetaine/carnitine-CoA ligase